MARIALLPRRYRVARASGTWSRSQVIRWLAASHEYTNFTYELTPASESKLAWFVGEVLGVSTDQVLTTLAELRDDEALARHIADTTRASPYRHIADPYPRYGRRAAWYALARLAKPRLVVETGVDKGLGACLFASALLRNAQEGLPGRYVGTDIDLSAGWLLRAPYDRVASVVFGDSLESLQGLAGPVDLFLHDSDHSAVYERAEYHAIAAKLSDGAIVLSDNAHVNDELSAFAAATGRKFDSWREEPQQHWYPGGCTGAAWRPVDDRSS